MYRMQAPQVASLSISKHSFYNLLGTLISVAVSLITIPIYLGIIGEDRYGILAIAWMLLGYFGLFDLGLGQATAQAIASAREDTAESRAEIFWTALSLNVALGVLGGAVIWPFADYYFSQAFDLNPALRVEALGALPWLMLAVPMATLSGVLTGGLQGREKFLELNAISVGSTVLFQLLPLISALLIGPDLRIVLPAVIVARAIALVALFQRCNAHVAGGFSPRVEGKRARKLLSFGGWVTVSSFVGPLMSIADRFVIGGLSGSKAVTHYTVPLQLAERGTVVSVALTSAMFPRVCAAREEDVVKLISDALRVLSAVTTVMICIGIFMMKPFLSWWISPEFANSSATVGQIILLGMWCNGLARVPFMQLTARGRPDLTARTHLVEVVPYFILLYLGIRYFGVVGAAVAFSIRVFFDLMILATLARILSLVARSLWLPAVFIISAMGLAHLQIESSKAYIGMMLIHLALTTWWALRRAPELQAKLQAILSSPVRHQ